MENPGWIIIHFDARELKNFLDQVMCKKNLLISTLGKQLSKIPAQISSQFQKKK